MGEDLEARLRTHAAATAWNPFGELCTEAAEEIERLRAERDALVEALRRLCHPNRHGRWKHALEYFLDFATEDDAMSHLRMVLGVDSPTSSSPPSASGPS